MNNEEMMRQNRYSRLNAVNYALTYAINPNPLYRFFPEIGDGGGDCSNFISQCLYAGGAPFDYGSNAPWWYNKKGTLNVNDDTWSVSWAVAHSLYWTLKIRGDKNLNGVKGIEVTNINMLELGDIIQYENYRGIIYHSAIITSFDYAGQNKLPRITQHTFNAANISYIKPAAKKMHFMKIIIS